MDGVVNSAISGVTITRANDATNNGTFTLLLDVAYGITLTNVTISAGTLAPAALGIYQHGNITINDLTGNGAGAIFFSGANASVTNMSLDNAAWGGRLFKTTATRYSTFNGLVVKNGVNAFNGLSTLQGNNAVL